MSASNAALPPLPLRHCYWVIPGLLLAGEHPNGPTRDKTRDRLKKLLAAGIECFVDLTKPTELLRYDTHLPFYVEYARKPIKDHGLPGSRAQMTEILDYIANSMRAGRPVYVHCRAGIGRTGTVVGCLLVERGLAGDGALDELNRMWQQCRRSKSWAFIPETDAQAAYIREWKPTLDGGRFELSSLATAVASVGPMTTAGSLRPRGLTVADVQARAASQATGAGQARAAVENLAASKGRSGSNKPAAGLAGGGGLAATASHAREAVERGEIPLAIRAEIADAIAGGSPTPKSGSGTPALVIAGVPDLDASATLELPGVSGDATARSRLADVHPTDGLANVAAPSWSHPANQRITPDSAVPQPRPVSRSPPDVRRPVQSNPEATVDFDPLLDPATLAAARNLRERFVGTLFGLAVGDAVAAATQFRRPGSFSPIGDMIGGGPFDLPRGAWSDDTAMALCLAESLLERDGFDARDQVERYSRWQQEGYLTSTGQCVGITASTARSLALAKWRRVVFPGSHDPEQLDPEPLSRIASVALFYFASPETTLVQSADASRTTCQAPAVLDACRRLGRALNCALSGQPKTKILAEAATITEVVAQTNHTAATALAAALWAFSSTDNFRDAVLRAANVGGNSDVVASVCGQLAGAHYGVSAIPQSWRNGLMHKDLIEGYADRLLAHGLVSLSNA
jgi:ADP-ribosyl-[dinitrogen reductase] hydrolase